MTGAQRNVEFGLVPLSSIPANENNISRPDVTYGLDWPKIDCVNSMQEAINVRIFLIKLRIGLKIEFI
jgi:hypothetical protein